ncbi:MAG: hypothetical protein ACYC21_09775 [Eubacteriales bacterium]
MKRFLNDLLDNNEKLQIKSMHQDQKNHYGVYIPPSLKQNVTVCCAGYM